MANPSPLRTYVDELNDLPADVLLGRVVLYTISDTPFDPAAKPTTLQQLQAGFEKHGLNKQMLPNANKRVDAFKKATSSIKHEYPLPRGRTGALLCREVSADPNFIERHIVREVRDSKAKVLSYDSVIQVRFYRPSSSDQDTARMAVTMLNTITDDEREFIRLVAREIKAKWDFFFDHVDGQKIRAMVRDYVKHLNAIEIKGGVYFVHASRYAELTRLSDLVKELGEGCHLDTLPIVDLQQQRELIVRVFEREASQSLREITKEAKRLLDSRQSISTAAWMKVKKQYDTVMKNAEEHMLNLEVNQEVTAASAEVAFTVLQELRERMLDE